MRMIDVIEGGVGQIGYLVVIAVGRLVWGWQIVDWVNGC